MPTTHLFITQRHSPGFTLIELSIVLVIIGLMAAAIMGGQHLWHQSRIQQLIEKNSYYTMAYQQFIERYQALPGDLHNANIVIDTNAENGDGNGLIDSNTEQSLAFQHLALAGFIDGTYTNSWSETPEGEDIIDATKYYFWSGSVLSPASTSGQAINITGYVDSNGDGNITTNLERYRARLSPDDMLVLDSKMDDGNALTGVIMAADGADQAANRCTSVAGIYNINTRDIACIMINVLEKPFR
jgi:prepilin-type N-terminal cleavage/methylation domain-containing protein